MTGLDNNNSVKIGTNLIENISKRLKKLKEKGNNIPIKIKKKNEARIEKKIKNQIDDLHWKTIKYLTQKYDNILLGDMSAKSIISKNNKVLHGMIKDICERIRFFQFRQRLEYKCEIENINFLMVNEYYTSKTCSNCGNYNEKLGGNKIYDCKKCKKIFDRDVNACRNIYMKALIE
jgi:putative transposase